MCSSQCCTLRQTPRTGKSLNGCQTACLGCQLKGNRRYSRARTTGTQLSGGLARVVETHSSSVVAARTECLASTQGRHLVVGIVVEATPRYAAVRIGQHHTWLVVDQTDGRGSARVSASRFPLEPYGDDSSDSEYAQLVERVRQ